MNVHTRPKSAGYTVTLLDGQNIDRDVAADYSKLISMLSERDVRISRTDLMRMAKNNHLFAAINTGNGPKVIGTGCLVVMDLPQGVRLLIESFVVHEDFRQLGIGHELLRAMIAKAKFYDAGHVTLTCNPKREDARRLYGDLGFAQADTNVYRLRVA